MGEGAAVFVLEREEIALARGVKPLAKVLGWGSSQDGYRTTAPRPDGVQAAKAMQAALRSAGITVQDIGYINAHGTGTPLNDPAEVSVGVWGAGWAYCGVVNKGGGGAFDGGVGGD